MRNKRNRYQSSLAGRWDRNATVRTHEHPLNLNVALQPAGETEYDYYSRSLVPAAEHDLVKSQSTYVQQALLIHHNYAFSKATSTLETEILNPTLLHLAEGLDRWRLPKALRLDARRIYVDESHHALIAEEGVHAMELATEIAAISHLRPQAFDEIGKAVEEFGKDQSHLSRFLFSFVLETMVSDTFQTLPEDLNVHPIVRESVRQHRKDEEVHHFFFRDAFLCAFPGMTVREQSIAAQLIPRFINAIVAPDGSQLNRILREVGFTASEATKVLSDVSAAPPLTGDIRAAAKSTLRYCGKSGLLWFMEAHRAFASFGLG